MLGPLTTKTKETDQGYWVKVIQDESGVSVEGVAEDWYWLVRDLIDKLRDKLGLW